MQAKAFYDKMRAFFKQNPVDDVAEDGEALAAAAATEMVSVRKAAVEVEVTDRTAAAAIERLVTEKVVIADQKVVTGQMVVIAKSRLC